MNRIIITVVGKDRVGIIARVCTYLSENAVNILDISQTIVAGYFNMMLIADMQEATREFSEIAGELSALGEEMGLHILAQKFCRSKEKDVRKQQCTQKLPQGKDPQMPQADMHLLVEDDVIGVAILRKVFRNNDLRFQKSRRKRGDRKRGYANAHAGVFLLGKYGDLPVQVQCFMERTHYQPCADRRPYQA